MSGMTKTPGTGVATSRRERAWRLRYLAHLNVCYWQEWVGLRRHKRRRLTWILGAAGAVLTLLVAFLGKTWQGTVATTASTLVMFMIGMLRDGAKTEQGEFGIERWSILCNDADTLWQDGELSIWRKQQLEVRLTALLEREKFCQSRECDPQDDTLVKKCQQTVKKRLLPGVDHEQREEVPKAEPGDHCSQQ